MLLCGAAKAVISPDLPIHVMGYGPDNVATRVHDDLHVAVLFLEDRPGDRAAAKRVAVLTYDLVTLDAAFVAEVQTRCAEATGLSPRSILTTASHAHSTPTVRPRRSRRGPQTPGFVQAYRERVIDRSVEALTQAVDEAVEVHFHYNYTRVRENLNRRVFFPDGQYFYQPRQKSLLPVADGPVDDELGMLYFCKGARRESVATLANYTAHPLTVGDTAIEVTADYPGVLKREVERNFGGTALFINGACGDNHPLGAEAGFGRCERMGQALAEKVLYHRWDSVEVQDPPVGTDCREVILPMMTDEEFARVPGNYQTRGRRPIREELIREGGIGTSFSLWAVGPVLFVGVPGEMCAELGLLLKWQSPFPKTYVMYLATDHIGYLPHRNAYEWGGYEAVGSPFGPDAGAKLCSEILAAAGELKARMEADGRRVALPGSGPGD
jgi:neutral ceramidase